VGGVGRGRRPLELLSRIPAKRLASQVATYDEIVGESGLAAGGEWALGRMARHAEVEGREYVPTEGPLLLVANHPGLADALALFATVPREDLRVVAAERPFLAALPNDDAITTLGWRPSCSLSTGGSKVLMSGTAQRAQAGTEAATKTPYTASPHPKR
jgi:acyltransferase-like protein